MRQEIILLRLTRAHYFPKTAMSSSSSTGSIVLSATDPHQPRTFQFPKRDFGKKTVVKRSFQPSWFAKWPWLHYVEERDVVLCFTCAWANSEKKIQWSSNADLAFVSKGFSNWKDVERCSRVFVYGASARKIGTTEVFLESTFEHKIPSTAGSPIERSWRRVGFQFSSEKRLLSLY